MHETLIKRNYGALQQVCDILHKSSQTEPH